MTIHLEREDESRDRNVSSSVLIVGFRGTPYFCYSQAATTRSLENVIAALVDLHAGHYDLKTNALVEMVYEIRGEHRQRLVTDDENYEKAIEIQVR